MASQQFIETSDRTLINQSNMLRDVHAAWNAEMASHGTVSPEHRRSWCLLWAHVHLLKAEIQALLADMAHEYGEYGAD